MHTLLQYITLSQQLHIFSTFGTLAQHQNENVFGDKRDDLLLFAFFYQEFGTRSSYLELGTLNLWPLLTGGPKNLGLCHKI